MRLDLFSKDDSVLLLGEGNFSFSVCLHKHQLPIKIISTCFESETAFKHQLENIEYLKSNKVPVFLNVDATKLHENANFAEAKFSKIVFNFPHIGGKMKIHLNRKLLKKVFESCSKIIAENGVMLVSLCRGQGGTPADEPSRRWDDSWQITEMAAHGNFVLTGVEPFLPENFRGYRCVGYRGRDTKFDLRGALVHILVRREPPYPCLSERALRGRMELVLLSPGSAVSVPVIYSELYRRNPIRNAESHISFFERTLVKSFNKVSPGVNWNHLTDDQVPVYLEEGSGVSCRVDSADFALRCRPQNMFPHLLKLHVEFPSKGKITLFPGMFFNPLRMDFLGFPPVEFRFLIAGENLLVKMKKFLIDLIKLFNEEGVRFFQRDEPTDFFPSEFLSELFYEKPEAGDGGVSAGLLYQFVYEGTAIQVGVLNAQAICQDLFRIGWREIWWGEVRFLASGKPTSGSNSLYPSSYSFDITLKYEAPFAEERFCSVLWLSAGRLIEGVHLVSEYTSVEGWSSKCFRITYRSLEEPLHRARVVEIHSLVVGRALELGLNVKIT